MRRPGSWGSLTRRTQALMLVLIIMLAGSAAGAARRQAQEQAIQGDDSECLGGLVDAVRQEGGDEDQSSALVTWTEIALRGPCNYTSTLKGITCNSNRRIVAISLPSADLVGTLPDSLSFCYFLQSLDLSSNTFSGSLPTALGALSFLSVLSLSNNNLSGQIPYELAVLSSLTSFDLRQNQLLGSIPPQLGLLSLHFFNVSYNKLSGRIPLTLSNTSSGSPRFDASCFAHNPLLYGFPLNPYPSFSSFSPPFSNTNRFSKLTIVFIVFSCGLAGLAIIMSIALIWVVWKDNYEEAEKEEAQRERSQKRRNPHEFRDGWKEVLERL